MQPLSHILVATDFSDPAAWAVERAASLARQHHATLHLAHVVDPSLLQLFASAIGMTAPASEQQLLDSARERLTKGARQLTDRLQIQVESALLIGRPHSQLTRYAAAHGIDLSLVGAHGANTLRDIFVGSTVSKFLRRGQQPTLIVRASDPRPYQQILVAVDFAPLSRIALEWALRIAPGASIEVLHVSDLPLEGKLRYAGVSEDTISDYRRSAQQKARQALDDFLDGIDGTANMTRSVMTGVPTETILKHSRSRAVDLVVMGKRGQLELDELLLGSVTQHMLQATDRDLLLVAPAPATP